MSWRNAFFQITTLFPGAEPARETAPPPPIIAERRFTAIPIPPRRRCVAFVVVHGMGQQVPYETLSMLAECMVRGEKRLGTYDEPPVVSVVRVKITDRPEDPPLARAQFAVKRKREDGGDEIVDVHVYEAY